MTTKITLESGNRDPRAEVVLPAGSIDKSGNDIEGVSSFVPLVKLDASSTVVTIPGSVEVSNDSGNPLPVKGDVFSVSANFTRPADTTAYAVGDLIANSTTAESVTPMSFDLGMSKGIIRSAKVKTSNTGASGNWYRLHLYKSSPTVTNGDNGAWLTNASDDYLGSIDVTLDKVFSGGTTGQTDQSEIIFSLSSGTIVYGLLEARSAATPASGATLTAVIKGFAA